MIPARTIGSRASHLLRELKRRHVFRVAVAYGAVSWAVLEVSSATFPALGIPGWSLSLLAMLLILGFPIALVLAWAYDITPAGVQRTPDAAAAATPGAAAVAILPAAPQHVARHAAQPTPPRLSIATLPFADGSADGGYQFLGDGIADELINGLARQGGLRVVGRTSSFSFRGSDADARRIADQLGVAFIVEGSIRVTGERLRINARLIDAQTGYATWSDSFDRQLHDLLAVQEEVAQAVVRALPAALDPSGTGRLVASTTGDVEAYTLYLRGRELWNERTPSALRRSIACFERALERDPAFARAHAGLADSYGILVDYGVEAPATTLPVARRSAARAVQLGADSAEAHAADALVRQLEGDWHGAELGLRHACTLNPAYSPARQRLALLLTWTGRHAEARAAIAAAAELDPVSPVIGVSRAWVEYYAGEHETAVRLLDATIAAHPGFMAARVPFALALLQLGRPAEAAAALEAHLHGTERTAAVVALHIHALARSGQRDRAAHRLAALRRLARRRYVPAYHLAVACTGLDRSTEAVALLRTVVDERAPQVILLRAEPIFAPLRATAEFGELLDRIQPRGLA